MGSRCHGFFAVSSGPFCSWSSGGLGRSRGGFLPEVEQWAGGRSDQPSEADQAQDVRQGELRLASLPCHACLIRRSGFTKLVPEPKILDCQLLYIHELIVYSLRFSGE